MGRKSRNRSRIPSQKKLSASNAGMPIADLRIALQQGMTLFQSGKLQDAEQVFKSVLAKDKKNISALQFLGITLFQTGRMREGEQMLRKAIQFNPKMPDLYYNLGMMLDRQDKLEQAVAAYRRALGLGPRNEWVQNNLGTVLGKLERLEDAEETIKGALEINPDNPSVLSNYGLILWRLNRSGDATKALERALDINEKCVDALTNMGIVCIANSEIDEAERYLRRAIDVDPQNFDAVNNLAVALLYKEKSDAALGIIQKALELRPESINAMLTMAKILVKKEDDKGAEECYHNVLKVMPSNTDAMVGIGSILSERGKFDGAKEFFEKALQVDPQIIGARVGLISIDSSDARSKEISELEAIYMSGDVSEEDKIRIAFCLANVDEKAGIHNRAFKYWVDGNSLKRKSFEYCLDSDREFFREIKSSFNEKFFQEHSDSGCHDKTPIFILGMPRSGTTLTEQILSSHPEVYGAGELADIKDIVINSCGSAERYETFPDILSKLGGNEYSRMGKDYIAGLKERYGNADRITDKLPHNFLHVGMIRLMLPNAKIIHCKRNPIDNCLSIFKQNFTVLHKYSHDLEELSGYYLLYQDLMEHWNRVLPGFMFELQYEDMVEDQEGMTRKLLEFCDLPWDDNCLQFHKSERAVKTASYAQVRKKIYSDSVQLWKRYEQELQPLISALEGNVL